MRKMEQRVAHWKHIYDNDDNAITKALSQLAWNFTAFSCVAEMVRHAPDSDEDEGKQINGMILEMLTSGFWDRTMQGIRRLAERKSIHGDHGVCSLGGLIADVRAVRESLTRRVFVETIAGFEYNYTATEGRHWQYFLSQPAGQPVWVPRELDYTSPQQRHEVFDWLSGTTPEASHPDDIIRTDVFDALERRLARLNDVVEHVNVEIAHAATEFSRTGRVLQRWNLKDAKEAIKDLAQIAQLTGDWFCNSGIGTVLPHPQFDQFLHLEKPFFAGDSRQLQSVWDALEREMDEWHKVDPRTL